MVVHRKNLLEAFRHAGSTPEKESEPSAGPFARSEPVAEAPRRRTPRAPAVPAWAPWAVGCLLAFAVGLAVGRASAPVEAGGGGGATPPPARRAPQSAAGGGTAPVAPASTPADVPVSHDDHPLARPENRFTIVVATYGLGREDFAWATHDYLRDAGFPVWSPVERGKNILVLVGASPTREALEPELQRLTGLSSWDGTPNAYSDAYPERIDRLIERDPPSQEQNQ